MRGWKILSPLFDIPLIEGVSRRRRDGGGFTASLQALYFSLVFLIMMLFLRRRKIRRWKSTRLEELQRQ